MFNKPNIFGRNEGETRQDGAPVLAATTRTGTSASDSSINKGIVTTRPGSDMQAARPTSTFGATPAPAPASKEPVNAAGSPSSDGVMGARLIVGPEVKLRGAEILDCDTLVVEGRVEATMDSRVIRIAENGSFAGKVSIDVAEIHGTFEGELTARSQLIIHSTGRVTGTIRYGKLVADEGCELCGDVNILSGNIAAKAKPVVEPFIALSSAAG